FGCPRSRLRPRHARGLRSSRHRSRPLRRRRWRRLGTTQVSAPLGVGLLGLGTVGSAVARAMATRAKRLEAMAGRPLRLIGAAARDPKKSRDAADVAVSTDPFELLDDPNVQVVIEVIGGTTPARDLQLA